MVGCRSSILQGFQISLVEEECKIVITVEFRVLEVCEDKASTLNMKFHFIAKMPINFFLLQAYVSHFLCY